MAVSGRPANSQGSIHVADNSVTAINDALQQLLFYIDELRGTHLTTNIVVGPHTHTAEHGGVLSIDHDDLTNVTADQHHDEDHHARHEAGGSDPIKLDDLATPDDNSDLNSTTGHHGLLPKLSGNATDILDGTGAFVPATASSEATDVANVEGSAQEQPWENIIAGSNITITELAQGNAISIAASGGSVGAYLVDAAPATPGADDDEFADNSGGVPGGWTEVDHGSVATVTEVTEGVQIQIAGGTKWAGIYKTIPAGDFTIWTKYSWRGRRNDAVFVAGLGLWEDATSSSGDLIYGGLYWSSGTIHWTTNLYSDYQTFNSSILSGDISLNSSDPAGVRSWYIRIRRTGTTYSFDYSADGISWFFSIASGSISFTPTHYGPICENVIGGFGPPDQYYTFQFFRYLSSDIGTGQTYGKRV